MLENKIKIIDAHVHFWDPINTPREVSSLNKFLGFNPNLVDFVAKTIFPKNARQFFGSPKYITRPYLPEDYKNDSIPNEVKGIVHVEAGWKGKGAFGPVGETEWLAKINANSDLKIMAIIVKANLDTGTKIESMLQAHLNASGLVKGVRDTLAWQSNKRILNGSKVSNRTTDSNWRKGFESLSKLELSFEATIYDNQIDELSALAKDYPNQDIMLSHLGTPIAVAGEFGGRGKTTSERERIFKTWQDSISKLAENRNVYIKLSGLAMPICGFGWQNQANHPSVNEVVDSFAPFINHAIKAFGVNRCLFGSNYPIDKVSLPLRSIIDAYENILTDLSESERHKVFFQNALEFYNISK